jgi:deoxyadenosine/deoxycytidine kinase
MKIKPLVVLDGLIGSGKTTLAEKIGKEMNLRILREPVETNPYLERFYKDMPKYAFGMQIALMFRRYAMQQLAAYECVSPDSQYSGAIIDRSLPGDRVFAKLHKRYGNIEELDWVTYNQAFDIMSCTLRPPSVMIFLDVEPNIALERIKRRARGAEVGITIEYLQDLQKGYYDLIAEIETGLAPWSSGMKVVKVPWNVDNQSTEVVTSIISHLCHL